MKKETYLKVVTLLLFSISPLLAQENIQLTGTVSAPFLDEASIHIINSTQQTGTVNSKSGSFQILVKENDELLFSSIQYKNVTVHITSEMIVRGTLDITLVEDLNVLDEVNISNVALTGNLNTDIANIPVVRDMPVNIKFGDIKNMRFEADINDPQSAPVNIAMGQSPGMGSGPGLDVLGLLFDLILPNIGGKDIAEPKVVVNGKITDELRKLFQEEFFTETLELEKDFIDDFIYYADDHGLRNLLEKPNNQLAVIEFLMAQSKIYNEEKLDQR